MALENPTSQRKFSKVPSIYMPRFYPGLIPGANKTAATPQNNYNFPIIASLEEAVSIAPTGAPIAFPMMFLSENARKYDKKGELIDVAMPDFRLPVLAIASFSRTKLAEITPMGSGRGSVKEVDGHSDWSIELSGLITPEANHPQGIDGYIDMLEHLVSWDECMNSVEVSSDLLTALGVYRVLIMELSFEQIRGVSDNCNFSMSLLSDEDFELEIIE